MAHDVFISHSSKDKAIADALCAALERDAVRCWMAPRDILPGARWAGSILDAIMASKLMVLVFSESADQSEHVRREVERAIHHRIPVAPVRIQNVAPNKEMEYFLSTSHWIDAADPLSSTSRLDELAHKIKLRLQCETRNLNASVSVAVVESVKRFSGRGRTIAAVATFAVLASSVALKFFAFQNDPPNQRNPETARVDKAASPRPTNANPSSASLETQPSNLEKQDSKRPSTDDGSSADGEFSRSVKRAEDGDVASMYYVAKSYRLGLGVKKDLGLAVKWMKMSAERENPDAMRELAQMYQKGEGMAEPNASEADMLFSRAYEAFSRQAANNQKYGMFMVGLMHERGEGMPKSRETAVPWYRKAAAAGETRARKKLNEFGLSVDG